MLVAEIVGPAGAGKTTLLRTLSQRNQKIRSVTGLKSAIDVPRLIGLVGLSVPTLIRRYPYTKGFTWRSLKMMVRLEVMQQELKRQSRNHWTVTILDQGPVFMLTRMQRSHCDSIEDQSLQPWWHCALKQWAPALDLVIWLDAPDGVLVERIHTRDKWHNVKGETDERARQFLASYRKTFDQVIENLCSHSSITVLRFDTAQESLQQITGKVMAVLNMGSSHSS